MIFRGLAIVASLLAASCTKKPAAPVGTAQDVQIFLNEVCFSVIAQGIRVNATYSQQAEKLARIEAIVDKKKAGSAKVFMFDNEGLDKQIRAAVAIAEPRGETFKKLAANLDKAGHFASNCRTKALDLVKPCLDKQSDAAVFTTCLSQEMQLQKEWMLAQIETAAGGKTFNKLMGDKK